MLLHYNKESPAVEDARKMRGSEMGKRSDMIEEKREEAF